MQHSMEAAREIQQTVITALETMVIRLGNTNIARLSQVKSVAATPHRPLVDGYVLFSAKAAKRMPPSGEVLDLIASRAGAL
jgi:hypothetical protein